VYPNWTRCGVQGGIPTFKVIAKIEDFGAKANDDLDDSDALQKACDAAGARADPLGWAKEHSIWIGLSRSVTTT